MKIVKLNQQEIAIVSGGVGEEPTRRTKIAKNAEKTAKIASDFSTVLLLLPLLFIAGVCAFRQDLPDLS